MEKYSSLQGAAEYHRTQLHKRLASRGEPCRMLWGLFKFNACRFTRPCFGGWSPYRKTRGTAARGLRDDTFRLYGSLQQTWLNNAPSSSFLCVWITQSRQTGNSPVGTNGRVLKVSAVQAPCRIDPAAGYYLHKITNSLDDHQSPTPFTRHIVPPWRLSFVSLRQQWSPWPIRLTSLYGHPSAQFPSWTACAVVRFIRRDSLSASCRAFWNAFTATKR